MHDELSDTDLSTDNTQLASVGEFLQQHNTALLVIMFTDLEGSTELAEQRGEIYSQDVRLKHDKVLKDIVHRDGVGRCIKNIGDALMCVFAKPTDAVSRAVEMQQAIADYNQQNREPPIHIRIGLHMGQVVVEGDAVANDVFGRHVNRAARVESLTPPGHILMTHPVYDSARGWLSDQTLTWHDHGHYVLKGIDDPTRMYEVNWPDGPEPIPLKGTPLKPNRRAFWNVTAAGLLVVVAALMAALNKPAETPLQTDFQLKVRRDGVLLDTLVNAVPLRSGDQLQLIATFDRPIHSGLVWIDEFGVPELITTSGETANRIVRFPADEDDWVFLEGGSGAEIAVVITANTPITDLPARLSRKADQRPLPGFDQPAVIHITPDGTHVTTEDTRALGTIQTVVSRNLKMEADKLRQKLLQDVKDFRGYVFPHE